MSKGQHQNARQPVSRVKGRETSQPRNPAGSGKPGGSSFIKSRPAQLPPGSGKPGSKRRKPDFGQPSAAETAPRDARKPQGRGADAQRPAEPMSRDARKPQGRNAHAPRPDESMPRNPRGPQGRAADTRIPAGEPSRGASPKATRAKKMIVREPGQQVMDRAKRLRETRVDHDRIPPVRLQKALAQSGVGSRREMETWIEAGFVLINGKKATLGDKVSPDDRVTVKGNSIKLKWADRLPRVILYHKQEGEIVSRDDPQGRVTIFDRLPVARSSRWVAIGRLDVNTSGLLILTTSGELANTLMHPSFEVEREYAVRVLGELTDEQKREMCREIMLEDGPARFERIADQGGEGANHWYRVVLREGRNREVRRMFEHFDLQVSRLMRVRFGQVALPSRLKRGQFYELNEVEVAAVMKWSHLTLTGGQSRR
jgi:23S rRNA pseudouridine2605 synthase